MAYFYGLLLYNPVIQSEKRNDSFTSEGKYTS